MVGDAGVAEQVGPQRGEGEVGGGDEAFHARVASIGAHGVKCWHDTALRRDPCRRRRHRHDPDQPDHPHRPGTAAPKRCNSSTCRSASPAPGEIRIRHHACGLNFIDVYQRTGLYPLPLPLSLGMEGAGVVEAVGEGVTHLKAGDRAAYASNPPGSYCERARDAGQDASCKLPDAISFETGAAMMLKGLTAQYLLQARRCRRAACRRATSCCSTPPPAASG